VGGGPTFSFREGDPKKKSFAVGSPSREKSELFFRRFWKEALKTQEFERGGDPWGVRVFWGGRAG